MYVQELKKKTRNNNEKKNKKSTRNTSYIIITQRDRLLLRKSIRISNSIFIIVLGINFAILVVVSSRQEQHTSNSFYLQPYGVFFNLFLYIKKLLSIHFYCPSIPFIQLVVCPSLVSFYYHLHHYH